MTRDEFKALQKGDLVVARATAGGLLVLEKVGPSHYRQGLNGPEMFSYFLPVNGRKIKVIKADNEIIYKIEFNA